MNSTELVSYFRLQVNDLAEPPLWTDAEIYQYLDAALRWFCRRTLWISDATTDEITQVACTAGEPFAAYDPRIIKLRAVFRGDGREIPVLNLEDLGRASMNRDYGLEFDNLRLDFVEGAIRAVVTGMQQDMMRLIQVPAEDETLTLIVNRYPLETISEANSTPTPQELEIDEQHHVYLVEGMKYFAFQKEDAETFDRRRSAEAGASFEAYCLAAKQERESREHKPRAVAYGGI